MDRNRKKQLIEYLIEFTTEERVERINEVLENRTRHITVILEDIYQPHNASAVLRSCDCFGIQDVHIIENMNRFDPSAGVALGADQWLTLHHYRDEGGNNTERCFERLQAAGYSIVAMSPHRDDALIKELPAERQTALLFGTELEGLSDYAMKNADGFAKIPMYGFSESYNISVSAALALYDLVSRLRKSGAGWRLSEEEKTDLRLEWLKHSIRAGEELVQKFLNESQD